MLVSSSHLSLKPEVNCRFHFNSNNLTFTNCGPKAINTNIKWEFINLQIDLAADPVSWDLCSREAWQHFRGAYLGATLQPAEASAPTLAREHDWNSLHSSCFKTLRTEQTQHILL